MFIQRSVVLQTGKCPEREILNIQNGPGVHGLKGCLYSQEREISWGQRVRISRDIKGLRENKHLACVQFVML